MLDKDFFTANVSEVDPLISEAIDNEVRRQTDGLELIASENFVSEAVLQAMGTAFTNKYAEGYPGKRYYGGCEFADVVEQTAIDRVKQLFGADHANVQPHSGAQANMAVLLTALEHGDTILGMNLSHGGHLTHGHPLNFSGINYEVAAYGVDRDTEQIDYDELQRIAEENRPKLLICGASAYPRTIDFERIGQIARSIDATVMADIAHIAGMVATGLHPSPVPHCEFVTTTTHKTLRGPRGGLVMCKEEFAKDLDRKVFPGVQGGPLVHIIAAKAVSFGEALRVDFKTYQQQIVANAKVLAETLSNAGLRLVSGGTDNHLLLVDVFMDGKGITGKAAEKALDEVKITVNKNTIPFDTQKPFVASGIRLGTPALTTRGMKEAEMTKIGELIASVIKEPESESVRTKVRNEVAEITAGFPDVPEAFEEPGYRSKHSEVVTMPTKYRVALSATLLTILILASAPSLFAQISDNEILPTGEKSDGCTLIPDGHIRDCCLRHDQEYFFGGTREERRESDKRLFTCITKKKGFMHKLVAPFIWLGVRIGGVPFLSTPFRWGLWTAEEIE